MICWKYCQPCAIRMFLANILDATCLDSQSDDSSDNRVYRKQDERDVH